MAEHTNTFPGWEFFVPLVEPHPETLFSLLKRPVVIWDELLDLKAEIPKLVEGWATFACEEVRDAVPPVPEPRELYLDEADFAKSLESLPQISLKELTVTALAPPIEVNSQAVVIGGELYFPPEGQNFAKELEESKKNEAASENSTIEATALPTEISPPGTAPLSDLPAEMQESASTELATSWPDAPISSQPSPKFQGGVKTLIEELRTRASSGSEIRHLRRSDRRQERTGCVKS